MYISWNFIFFFFLSKCSRLFYLSFFCDFFRFSNSFSKRLGKQYPWVKEIQICSVQDVKWEIGWTVLKIFSRIENPNLTWQLPYIMLIQVCLNHAPVLEMDLNDELKFTREYIENSSKSFFLRTTRMQTGEMIYTSVFTFVYNPHPLPPVQDVNRQFSDDSGTLHTDSVGGTSYARSSECQNGATIRFKVLQWRYFIISKQEHYNLINITFFFFRSAPYTSE